MEVARNIRESFRLLLDLRMRGRRWNGVLTLLLALLFADFSRLLARFRIQRSGRDLARISAVGSGVARLTNFVTKIPSLMEFPILFAFPSSIFGPVECWPFLRLASALRDDVALVGSFVSSVDVLAASSWPKATLNYTR